MLNSSKNLKQSYQNVGNNSNLIIKINDVVKVSNIHYMVDSINNNSFSGTDMYGNSKDLFIDDIQKIVFDSSSQKTIEQFLNENRLKQLEDSLADIRQKLKNPMTGLQNIKTLKKLEKRILEDINKVHLETIDIA